MSVRKRLYNLVKTSVTSTTPQDLNHVANVENQASNLMLRAKKKWLLDYQLERDKKQEYVKVNVLAQNLNIADLQAKITSLKNTLIPSLDDITMTELENIVAEMVHEDRLTQDQDKREEEDKDQVSDVSSSMALYDKLMAKEDKELDDSVSSVRSSNSFRSLSTRKSKLTVLNQKAFSQICVTDVYQLITSKFGKMVRGQSLMVQINTLPMNWKV